jgi:ubiquinone/menaquinone biosynthesis C-methylase UbiE
MVDGFESAYDEIAEWYDGWVGSDSMDADPFFPAAAALMGEVAGRRICDLACGQGRVARHLAGLGARVIGVDISAKLLEIARRHEAAEPRGITYLRGDAQRLDRREGSGSERHGIQARVVEDGAFDGVVCFMALMDIPDLRATLQTAARILRPGGWFAFAIIHPCYNPARSGEQAAADGSGGTVRTVAGYFAEGYWRSEHRTGPPGKVGSYHRTLSTYVNTLAEAGLTIERLAEPPLTGAHAARRPVWREVPAVLVARCRKGGRANAAAMA